MTNYFISDDTFFLYGIAVVTAGKTTTSVFINLNEKESLKAFKPVVGDIIVVAVNHHLSRKEILQKSIMPFCRVVIILDMLIKRSRTIEFPCLISKTISSQEFINFLHVIKNVPVTQGTVSKRVLDIFNRLGAECSAKPQVAGFDISMGIIYRIKRNVFQKYGLLNCNSLGLLVCQDMLRMKIPV
ncbi:hypothetical protein N6A11_003185 [Klebsiella oxytoca]|nr:hypothetical protein [Klebsiella oxytoca]